MPTASSIVINDGQAVPVAHTFAYVPMPENVAGYEDRAGAVVVGYNRITMSLTRPRNQQLKGMAQPANRNYRARIKIDVPTLETVGTNDAGITPPPSVAYRTIADLTITIPERSTLANRKDALAYIKNVLSNAQAVALIHDLDPPY